MFPIDSTIITLTSKLLWTQGYHQVKLFGCFDSIGGGTEGTFINFGFDHLEKKLFILRINQNYCLELLEDGGMKVGTGKKSGNYRVVSFCSLENKAEYRLVTNLPASGERAPNLYDIDSILDTEAD